MEGGGRGEETKSVVITTHEQGVRKNYLSGNYFAIIP